MRFIIGFLSGVLGLLAGWAGLAFLVIGLAGPDRDGGIAMGAFFQIGPLGGLLGFIAGVVLFIKFGMKSKAVPSPDAEPASAPTDSPKSHASPAFAVVVLLITGGLAWWAWYELIRSPYLTHGFMTLEMQFRLPAGMALPPDATDVHVTLQEGQQPTDVMLGQSWHGTDGDRRAILATATLSRKTSRRVVTLELPGVAPETWQLDLANDPDPTPGFSPWRLASGSPSPAIEMDFQLHADH
jgi:hypothetical protein